MVPVYKIFQFVYKRFIYELHDNDFDLNIQNIIHLWFLQRANQFPVPISKYQFFYLTMEKQKLVRQTVSNKRSLLHICRITFRATFCLRFKKHFLKQQIELKLKSNNSNGLS